MTEDCEFDIIFLVNHINEIKDILKPLCQDNKNGVALTWNSSLQKQIKEKLK